MKKNTICFIVNFDDFTRQACVEALPQESFSTITVEERGRKVSLFAWATTIGFAKQIRDLGRDQNKAMTFRVVVASGNGKLRFAKQSEWIINKKKRESLRRTVNKQITRMTAKRILKGRLGVVS